MARSFASQTAYNAKRRAAARMGNRLIVASKLPNANGNEAIMSAMAFEITKGAKEFLKMLEHLAKANLAANDSVRTGLLQKAVVAKVETYENRVQTEDGKSRKAFGIWGGLGINKSIEGVGESGEKIWPVHYAHLVEFGHEKGANKRGNGAPPKPFMRKAFADVGGVPAIQKMFEKAAKKGLEKGAQVYGKSG